jgi:surface protein
MGWMFYQCYNLTSLDLSNWNTSNVTNMNYIFDGCSLLNNIIMDNSDYNSVNRIISELPTRTSDSMGTLNIAEVDNINQIDRATAGSKYWNVVVNERSYFILGKSKLGRAKLK